MHGYVSVYFCMNVHVYVCMCACMYKYAQVFMYKYCTSMYEWLNGRMDARTDG